MKALHLRRGFVPVLVALAASACKGTPNWDRRVETYGTLREVLAAGETEGRVILAEAAASPHAVGIGALEGLAGEVVVFEGEVYTGRRLSDRLVSTHGPDPRERAAFLALAEVPHWDELRITRTVSLPELEPYLKRLAGTSSLAKAESFPFVIEGELRGLKAHVIDGNCPIAHPEGPPPVRREYERVDGRLVGFYSDLPPGTLTHHGTRCHVHVILAGAEPLVAHVDEVSIVDGATLLVPTSR